MHVSFVHLVHPVRLVTRVRRETPDPKENPVSLACLALLALGAHQVSEEAPVVRATPVLREMQATLVKCPTGLDHLVVPDHKVPKVSQVQWAQSVPQAMPDQLAMLAMPVILVILAKTARPHSRAHQARLAFAVRREIVHTVRQRARRPVTERPKTLEIQAYHFHGDGCTNCRQRQSENNICTVCVLSKLRSA